MARKSREPIDAGPRYRLAAGLVSMLLVPAIATGVSAGGPGPTLEGPITGGAGMPFVDSTSFDLARVGYLEAEYFISGTATAYTTTGALTPDGKWTVTAGDTAGYKTRILVYRPAKRRKFNGTVVVEWLNVTPGYDDAVDWRMTHTELIRRGYAWMGVSAQFVAVEGGPTVLGLPSIPLKTVDPARYGSLVHPGDSFSYDIFSQAGQAIRQPGTMSPLGDLEVEALIASGESQSANLLVTYINAIHPLAAIYDGFLVNSRLGVLPAPLSQSPQQPTIDTPLAPIRDDLRVPVLTMETETDVALLGYFSVRQPDSDRFRLWEIAGTAHGDTYEFVVGRTDEGNSPTAAALVLTSTPFPGLTCGLPINSGPEHFVGNAAISALNRWVRRGRPPPRAARLDAGPGPMPAVARDAHGNALGGVRTPPVDVPIATLSGEGLGADLCPILGSTVPLDAGTLASLYPSHRAYVRAFNKATRRAVRAGFILKPDAKLMRAAAAGSDVGR